MSDSVSGSVHDSDTAAPEALSRRLGLFHLAAAGTGTILGAGIYVLVGAAAGKAGGLIWVSFILAAATAGLTGLSYAELASRFPRAGAGYEYARRAFGSRVGLFTGWLIVSSGMIGAGTVALGFGGYFEDLTGIDSRIAAIILLIVGAAVAATNVLRSILVVLVLTAVEVGGLVLICAIGLGGLEPANLTSTYGATGVLSAAALVFFAFIGFEDIATFAEEAREPERSVPRAIIIAVSVATVLYILVAVASVGSVGADSLAASGAPLALVARDALGSAAGDTLGAIALAATANTALLFLMATSRRVYGIAASGALPAWLAGVSETTRVPVRSLVVITALAVVVTAFGDIGTIAEMTNVSLFLSFIVINAAVIALRQSQPPRERTFLIPGAVTMRGRVVPVLPLLAIVASLVLMSQSDVIALAGGLALGAVGVGVAIALGGRVRDDFTAAVP